MAEDRAATWRTSAQEAREERRRASGRARSRHQGVVRRALYRSAVLMWIAFFILLCSPLAALRSCCVRRWSARCAVDAGRPAGGARRAGRPPAREASTLDRRLEQQSAGQTATRSIDRLSKLDGPRRRSSLAQATSSGSSRPSGRRRRAGASGSSCWRTSYGIGFRPRRTSSSTVPGRRARGRRDQGRPASPGRRKFPLDNFERLVEAGDDESRALAREGVRARPQGPRRRDRAEVHPARRRHVRLRAHVPAVRVRLLRARVRQDRGAPRVCAREAGLPGVAVDVPHARCR